MAGVSRTLELFPGTKPPRQPRKLMHVTDCGDSGTTDGMVIEFTCARCGHCTGWILMTMTLTESKRGIPCPKCNKQEGESNG